MMAIDIERQFYDTFGIEARQTCKVTSTCNNYINYNDCNGCNAYKYPQITDHILLELICILSKYQKDRGSLLEIGEISLDEIKEEILEMLIYREDGCRQQVQAIFKGGI